MNTSAVTPVELRARLVTPIAAIVIAGVALHAFEGAVIGTPWLVGDETTAARAAASLVGRAQDGGTITLYSLVTAPLWLGGTATGYTLVKLLGALLVALVALPTYHLALIVTSRGRALGAAIAAVALPATLYAAAVEPAAFAYLPATAAMLYATRFRLDRRRRDAAKAVILATIAIAVWPAAAFVLLPAGLLTAGSTVGWRRLAEWPGAAVLGALALVGYAAYYGLRPHSSLVRTIGDGDAWRLFRDAIAALGMLAVATLVVGFGAAVVSVTQRRRSRELRALADLGVVATAAAAAASALSASSAGVVGHVDERFLLLAVPIVVTLAVITTGLPAPRRSLATAAAVTAVALAFLWRVPAPRLDAHAPSLAIAHPFGVDAFELALVWIVLAGLVLLAARAIGGRRLSGGRAALTAIGLVLAVAVVAQGVAADAARKHADELDNAHATRAWPGGRTAGRLAIVAAARNDAVADAIAFWNPQAASAEPPLGERSIDSVTGAYSPPLPTASSYFDVGGTPAASQLAGRVLANVPAGLLVAADPPERARQTVEGLYDDGWTGAHAVYRYFAPGRNAPVEIVLSRTQWGGPDVANGVNVSIGPLGSEPEVTQHVTVHAGDETTLTLQAPAGPFQVIVDSETFSPSSYGQADTRQLGVQPTIRVAS
jgi:hypothetical protein